MLCVPEASHSLGQPLGPVLQEDTWPAFIQTYSGVRSNVAKHA